MGTKYLSIIQVLREYSNNTRMIQTQIEFCTSQARLTIKPFLGELRLLFFKAIFWLEKDGMERLITVGCIKSRLDIFWDVLFRWKKN